MCLGLMPIGYVVRLDLCIHILTILVLCNSLYKGLLSMNKMMILLLSLSLHFILHHVIMHFVLTLEPIAHHFFF